MYVIGFVFHKTGIYIALAPVRFVCQKFNFGISIYKRMELRKFIVTTIREYLNEQLIVNDNTWYHGSKEKFDKFKIKTELYLI